MYDIAGTRQALRRSRGETSGYPARNHTVVAENEMLRSGSEIKLTPTNKMLRMKGNITKHRQQIETKHICSACYDNNIIGFVILILSIHVLKTMYKMTMRAFNILSRDNI